jgi:hypothetical protein
MIIVNLPSIIRMQLPRAVVGHRSVLQQQREHLKNANPSQKAALKAAFLHIIELLITG